MLAKRQDSGSGYMDLMDQDQLKIATYNVLLTPKWGIFRWLCAPKLRYKYQIETLLPSLGADIICLQECTREYLRMLNKSSLCDSYIISNHEIIRDKLHFPLILSKFPFEELLIRDRAIYGLFERNNKPFICICIHLNTLGKTKAMRAIELSKINQNLQIICELADEENQKAKIKQALDQNNVIILGDFNMHFPSENKIIEALNYKDLWLDSHSHFTGYTYDGRTNKLLWTLQPFDNRRLRLDRIILKNQSHIEPLDIQLFGNKLINSWCKKRLFPTMPSDHYGIILKCKLSNQAGEQKRLNMYLDEFRMLPQDKTGFRKVSRIWLYRTLASVLLFVALCAFIYYLLKALF
ncbi:unnamed protein product [Moneuplotes crassus]|uniref:Endonuclease/exonuclease/phosphatase domain-containing protein n=1 Tax=Euplotes crassus TaxID=5936 RepID=A0AAD1XIM4_EUPCR|nr:unnamed protein product [Moneuplotes crassus]